VIFIGYLTGRLAISRKQFYVETWAKTATKNIKGTFKIKNI